MHLFNHGELVTVETERGRWLGRAESGDGVVIVRTGFVGRPVVLAVEDVTCITPAVNVGDLDDE